MDTFWYMIFNLDKSSERICYGVHSKHPEFEIWRTKDNLHQNAAVGNAQSFH